MSVDENKTLVRRLVEAWNTRNLAVLDDLIDPDYVDHYAVAGRTVGRESCKRDLNGFLNAFPDSKWTIEDIVSEGDKVVVRMTVSGTHKGELWGIKPTGKRIKVAEISIWRIANGKFVEEWGFGDRLGGLQQLGVTPLIGQLEK